VEKICATCKINKDVNEFHKDKSYKDGYKYSCKECLRNALEERIRLGYDKKDYIKKYYIKNKDKVNKQNRDNYYLNGGKEKQKQKAIMLKIEIMSNYGGCCTCCGENNLECLTIDHINNDGKQHRKEIGIGCLYKWLKDNNFPKENFQILCYNCNMIKFKYGECPHQRNFREEIISNENLY
jgi:5-methylcytosine-specific restriction endonuclease McrA